MGKNCRKAAKFATKRFLIKSKYRVAYAYISHGFHLYKGAFTQDAL